MWTWCVSINVQNCCHIIVVWTRACLKKMKTSSFKWPLKGFIFRFAGDIAGQFLFNFVMVIIWLFCLEKRLWGIRIENVVAMTWLSSGGNVHHIVVCLKRSNLCHAVDQCCSVLASIGSELHSLSEVLECYCVFLVLTGLSVSALNEATTTT